MKRIFGYVLFTLGLSLIFLSPLLLLYAVPRIEKAPTDTNETVVSDGQGSYFSAQDLMLISAPVQNIELLQGDPSRGTNDVAVVLYTSNLVNATTKTSISYDQETYAMNRHTGVATNCCGEQPKMSGVTLKFPFGTQKQTYRLWDPTANTALPVNYARTDEVDGVQSYVFFGKPVAVQIGTLDLPNSLIGVQGQGVTTTDEFYQAATTVWVEPTTGRVLKGEKDLQQWVELSGTKVLELADLKIGYDDETVARFAIDAKKDMQQLKLVSTIIPILGPIIGVILVVIGLVMLRGPKSTSTSSQEPQAQAA